MNIPSSNNEGGFIADHTANRISDFFNDDSGAGYVYFSSSYHFELVKKVSRYRSIPYVRAGLRKVINLTLRAEDSRRIESALDIVNYNEMNDDTVDGLIAAYESLDLPLPCRYASALLLTGSNEQIILSESSPPVIEIIEIQ